ncbi:PPOX class F420-dependent oxidoreductase [Antrihabitans cavernicola]|uniref:PPOX class F420-dependent oxidoreductase n=1 Tax=Antrihabitans cavernicola TaxID=2495913 RepID=A0A5A7S837_9NOCA|nr:PPOX class F420-dependent oxidoreductase [Spelaeibacter cavernicola]KAA0021312.1 PPOX class F420-dependent oxidoreductase [Spelaeibacter cavernicola]
MTNPFGAVGTAKYVLLTTFKKDGTPVGTPLWAGLDGDRLIVWTEANSWKVKRIRRNPAVTMQPCDLRGKPNGDVVDGTATVLDEAGSDHAREVIMKKYGLIGWLTVKGSGLRRGKSGTIGIAIAAK